tara:strand:- start:17002 stop:17922 length:921 start_codon:yes stop_codon:yes gene_type:complete
MAETYTDSTGKVFPVNQFGRPMGYFDGNTFVFPRFGDQPAVTQPVVEPLAPVAADPVVQPMRQPGMVVQTPNDGETPPPSGPPGGVTDGFGTTQYSTNIPMLTGGVLGVNPINRGALAAGLGSTLGRLSGIPGAGLFGNVAGSLAGGRSGAATLGDLSGSVLGGLLGGPIGALGGGIVGGRMGDVIDAQNTLALGDRGRRGFLGTLGYGFGLGPSLNEQLEDYYGINQPGIDPFGVSNFMDNRGPASIPGSNVIDDIGDIDPRSGIDYSGPFSDPFQDIADVFDLGGDADTQFGGDEDFGDMEEGD